MGVELVGDKHPFYIWISCYRRTDVGHKVVFGPGLAKSGTDDFTGSHFKIGYQGLCAMPRVFKLVQLKLPFGHGMVGMYPFQCLNARLFINTDHMHARLMKFLCLMVKFTHIPHVLPKVRFILDFMVQPIFDPMGF